MKKVKKPEKRYLKTCPKCKAHTAVFKQLVNGTWYVLCRRQCGKVAIPAGTKDAAARRWNRRELLSDTEGGGEVNG